MFRNFIKVGLRNLWKNKIFSFINIFGLAASMSICLLIMLMLADQKEYDQFHKEKDRIYRILTSHGKKSTLYATSPLPTAKTLLEEYPIIEKSTSIHMGVGGDATYDGKTIVMRGFFADPGFFDVLSFNLVQGNKALALKDPRSLVITTKLAKNLFGNQDPVGKTIHFNDRGLPHLDIEGIDNPPVSWGDFLVTGVIDVSKTKSHLKFDALMSNATMASLIAQDLIEDKREDWKFYYNTYTLVKTKEGKYEADLQIALDDLVSRKYAGMEDFKELAFTTQKLGAITPGKFLNNMASFRLPIEAYYFLSFLALVIMVSACLNYTNLSIARSLTRSKEIGIRKVTGALRRNLIWQFLGESVITSLLALVLAIIMLNIMKPVFMSLWINKYLNFNLTENIPVFVNFIVFAVLIGLIAGIIPSLHLSKFQPIKVLKSNFGTRMGKIGFRKVLTISQFVVSLFFIVTTILIIRQTRHYIHFEYGFETKNMINIELQGNDFDLVANEFTSIQGVSNVAACQHLPASGISMTSGLRLEGSEDEYQNMGSFYVHPGFLENLDLEIISGANFMEYNRSKTEKSVIINETAVKDLGFESAEEAIGKLVEVEGLDNMVAIVGVVKNFQFRLPMFDDRIGPMVFRNGPDQFSYLNLKVDAADTKTIIADLKQKWSEIDPVHDFEFSYFDQQMANNYQIFTDVISVIGFFAFISISIACLGLLGISTYTVERRIKEVGIRKVLGAGEYTIAYLLSGAFIKMLLISIVIASPLVYFINDLWLQEFSHRISYGFGTIFSGAMIMLVLGLATVASQTWRITKINPADTLRTE
jgi:putative ABC transport system permease protein